jgi:hypothetical protein
MLDFRSPTSMIAALRAILLLGLLALVACTPENTPASAARTAAALRTPAAAAATPPAGGAPRTPAPPRPNATPVVPVAPTPTPGVVRLTASPDHVQVSAGGLGTTTISWSTGKPEDGEVYVSENGQAEKLFASGSDGSQDAPWIRAGATYEFRLFAGTGHKERLATLIIGAAGSAPKLTAEPNPVPADDEELGTTTITWATEGPQPAEIYVSEDGGPQRLFATGIAGSEVAGWICRGITYEFFVYAGPGQTNRVAALTVTRGEDEPDHEPPPSERCHEPETE